MVFPEWLIKKSVSRKAMEKKISDFETQLDALRHLAFVGKITGQVAHDLNNAFTGTGSYPEVLMMNKDLSPEMRLGLEMIRESGQKASGLVRDLLTICQGPDTPKENTDFNEILENYIQSADFKAVEKRYKDLEIQIDKYNGVLNISGSYLHIEKLIANMILYAATEVEDNNQPRIKIKTAAKIFVEPSVHPYGHLGPGEYVIFEISCNSCSITEKIIPDKKNIKPLFEPFVITKKMGKKGTGLEMTLVWATVKDHNGYVHLEYNGNETRFEFLFPAALRKQ